MLIHLSPLTKELLLFDTRSMNLLDRYLMLFQNIPTPHLVNLGGASLYLNTYEALHFDYLC